jgi:predicted methyltransferase
MFKALLTSLIVVLVSGTNVNAEEADFGRLSVVLSIQPEEVKARYQYRHPQETLEFFEVTPGMVVVEALPGQGWYSKILMTYLGSDGMLIGADYSDEMYPMFGFFSEDQLAERSQFVTTFPTQATDWGGRGGASVGAFKLGMLPEEMKGQADMVLFIRALHNLTRFESDGGFLTAALQNAYDVLKPGGLVGVVQHEAREDMSDEFADGSHGYLKKAFVIEAMQEAGFEFIGETDANLNENDQPSDSDIVWRLPPSLVTSRDNPELKAEMEAIGESNRMTLKFMKPE